jgi:GNAT superfamily N-acetyltransferase
MEIYNLKDKIEYLDEVMKLEYDEWAENKEVNRKNRIERKKDKFYNLLSNDSFCKLILLDGAELIGFISLFPEDCEEEKELSPWYATMYVKKEYRKCGYSRMLNDAILKEAKNRGFKTIYLKTNLKNYYEKLGAIFIKKLKSGEKLYKFELYQ